MSLRLLKLQHYGTGLVALKLHKIYDSYLELRKKVAQCKFHGQIEFWTKKPAVYNVNGLGSAGNQKSPANVPALAPLATQGQGNVVFPRVNGNVAVRSPLIVRSFRAPVMDVRSMHPRGLNVNQVQRYGSVPAATQVRNVLYTGKQGVILLQNGASAATQPQNVRVFAPVPRLAGNRAIRSPLMNTVPSPVAVMPRTPIANPGIVPRPITSVSPGASGLGLKALLTTSDKPLPAGASLTDATTNAVTSAAAKDGKESTNAAGVGAKTFPSLVVVVKPCLHDKIQKADVAAARTKLDQTVKNILARTPSQFVEWLLTRKLIKVEPKCYLHRDEHGQGVSLKLAKSVNNDDPVFYGGYAWIAECCAKKTVSIFDGSIFDPSAYSPHTILKLIYHWSCQTSATNVISWCKVKESYLKNFYTLLRSICVAAIYDLCPRLGGFQKVVEIGLITLGAEYSAQSGKKQMQVEILGVYDHATKVVRLTVILPSGSADSGETMTAKTRSAQLLDALKSWVDPSSILVIDASIEKAFLVCAGFINVVKVGQVNEFSTEKPLSNEIIVNYLKNVIPKMFQTTLCVLSKMLMQHFLDELTWRERWGQTSNATFKSILDHLHLLTQHDYGPGGNLVAYLNKISVNPFYDWSLRKASSAPTGIDLLPDSIRSLSPPAYMSPYQSTGTQEKPPPPAKSSAQLSVQERFTIPELSMTLPNASTGKSSTSQPVKRKVEEPVKPPIIDELTEYYRSQPKSTFAEAYYYAEYKPLIPENAVNDYPDGTKCPLCSKPLTSNDIYRHIFAHVACVGRSIPPSQFCKYCLKDTAHPSLQLHTEQDHKLKKKQSCWICLEDLVPESKYAIHMWENHNKSNAPYKCDVCGYRSSFHADVVDHFIQQHQDRRGKKCTSCCLVFSNPSDSKAHVTDCHMSDLSQSNSFAISMYAPSKNEGTLIAKPPTLTKRYVAFLENAKDKLKQESRKPNTPRTTIIEEDECSLRPFLVVMNGAEGATCLECQADVEKPDHFPGHLRCLLCPFSTCCRQAIHRHHNEAHPPGGPPKLLRPIIKVKRTPLLDVPMVCECEFLTRNPNRMAFHLAKCKRYKAVPLGYEYPVEQERHEEDSAVKEQEQTDACRPQSDGPSDFASEEAVDPDTENSVAS